MDGLKRFWEDNSVVICLAGLGVLIIVVAVLL